MFPMKIEDQFAASLGRTHAVIVGRGTTALWLALRAIRRRDGPGEVILPDLLCPVALDGVLLAGFTPIFADVLPGRYTLSPASVARHVTPRTRAVLVAHLYGHIADLDAIRRAAPGIPIIEDAVQGFGGSYQGRPVGSLGDFSFISFDRYKMIGGRGGVLFFEDGALWDGIAAEARELDDLLTPIPSPSPAGGGREQDAVSPSPLAGRDVGWGLAALLPPTAAAGYAAQLGARAPSLLRGFDPSPANLDRIRADRETLSARRDYRNAHAHELAARLAGLPLALPDLRAGDALWCYTILTPTAALARRVVHGLRQAGLPWSTLYAPLSSFFGRDGGASWTAGRLVNLWIDESAGPDVVARTARAVAGTCSTLGRNDLER